MYKAGDAFPLLETDAVSDANDARQIEVFLAGTGLPYTFFRPQVCVCVDCVGRWMALVSCVLLLLPPPFHVVPLLSTPRPTA